ncbi:MAG: D-2-hydroxyacid dehydrogenase [Dehalococcoidia bacterium]
MPESSPFPPKETIKICFAHIAYQMDSTFEKRDAGVKFFQVRSPEELDARISEADVLVISGLWENRLLDLAPKLRFIQSIGAGYNQFSLDELKARGIRLASASGRNRNAVSEHVFALILALTRQTYIDRDNQHKHFWRGMITDLDQRQDELPGKTLGIVGLGAIGSRVAKLGKAFDMRVIATKRNPATAQGPVDEVYTPDHLDELLGESDFVVLTCPLTEETRGLIDDRALSQMKPSAYLVNVARGACVDEPSLLEALRSGEIAGAALDTFWDEPLPEDSPFWDLENVVVTPHTGGETRMYEANIIDILLENLDRLWRGEDGLINQVV